MHILTVKQFGENQIDRLFSLADSIRSCPMTWENVLSGKVLGTLFFEPSMRTRQSFEAAMVRLGGRILTEPNAAVNSSIAKGESLEDTVQTFSQYIDCLVMRHPIAHSVMNVAKYSDVPVINGGDGPNEHPTQALLDLYTIDREKGLNKLKILFTGDLMCSRTIHSLVSLLERYDVEMYLATSASDCGGPKIQMFHESCIKDYIGDMDVVYMTRHQRERVMKRQASEFVMTCDIADLLKKDAIIMHPLPRTGELPSSIDAYPQAIYLKKQVKNGMWIRMALLWELLK